jgi:predicted metalloprotease with PDZ domain
MSEGFLGVATDGREPSEGDRPSAVEHRVVVSEVLTGSPADRYGIQRGDLIVSFGAEPIDSIGELTRLVHRAAPGDEVRIGIERHGRLHTVDVLMGDRSATYIYLQSQQQASARRRSLQQDLQRLERQRHSVLKQLENIDRRPRTDPPPPPKGRASSSTP